MKILYIGPIQKGTTTLQRMWSLEQLGHYIISFDITPYMRIGTRIERSIVHRLNAGRQLIALNRGLCVFSKDKEYDCVWVDKGVWIYPETLADLKKNKNILLIHYTPDPQITFHKSRHFFRCIPVYDILVTTKSYEVDLYQEKGARHLIFTQQGYDDKIFRPYPEIDTVLYSQLKSDVCFIGRSERHYSRCIKKASEATSKVAVWGRWGRYAKFNPWFRPFYRDSGIWEENYAKALYSAKIALGLLSKLAPDFSTTRSFEIPACGAFMLAERTEEHLELFEEGKEAAYFSSKEELREKIVYYLKHDKERINIAVAGRQRCLQSGYSNTERLKIVMKKIIALRNHQF